LIHRAAVQKACICGTSRAGFPRRLNWDRSPGSAVSNDQCWGRNEHIESSEGRLCKWYLGNDDVSFRRSQRSGDRRTGGPSRCCVGASGPVEAPAIVEVLQPLSEYIRLASENASTTYASVSNMGFPQQLPRCSCPAPPGNWSLAGLRRGAQADKGSVRRISLRAGVLVATSASPILARPTAILRSERRSRRSLRSGRAERR